MASLKELKGRINSVKSTQKITKAKQMVAAAKLRRAQSAAEAARPYSERLAKVMASLAGKVSGEGAPKLLAGTGSTDRHLLVVVNTDKGLCGGLNTNVLRSVTTKLRELQDQGVAMEAVAIGNKGLGFLNRVGAKVVSQVTQLGDRPHLEKLIGPVKVLLDAYAEGRINAVYLSYTKFINTVKQEPVVEQLLPLKAETIKADENQHSWDYIYEPDAQSVIDELLVRYVESLIYQAVAENMASEHSARMVAMKAATDNAGNVIGELKLVYNKTRQAAITKELSEIVSGAAAISG